MKKCKVISVKSLGMQKTYSVTMKSSQHNYRISSICGNGVYSKNSHSAAYAFIAYQTAYLKLYYPLEFMANLISTELGNDDKVNLYLNQAKQMHIVILNANINTSGLEFKIEKGVSVHTKKPYEFLRSPFVAIKGVGEKSVQNIIENQPYSSLKEFISKIDMRKVNISVFKTLLDAGCMDNEWNMTREDILSSYEKIKEDFNKEKVREKNAEKKMQKEQDRITETFGGGSLFDQFGSM